MDIHRGKAFLRRLMIAALPAVLAFSVSEAAKPNIVLILMDDLGYGDVSCYNPESKIATPHIDSLAASGMKFTGAYANDGNCTPSRYGLLTGRYCWRSRLKMNALSGWDSTLIEHGRMTTGSMLKDHGYATALIGKWHLGLDWALINPSKPTAGDGYEPARKTINVDFSKPMRYGLRDYGFDFSFIHPASLDMAPYLYIRNDTVVNPDVNWITNGGKEYRNGYASKDFKHVDVLPTITRVAGDWIVSHVSKNPDKPFYLHFCLTSPHNPHYPSAQFKGTSGIGNYGDFVVQSDWIVGRIMEILDSLDLRKSTMVYVTSDNGPEKSTCALVAKGHYSNGELRGYKRDTWDGGVHVPFIVSWPGVIKPGSVTDETVCITDFMATTAAILGYNLPPTAGEDSYSILPVLLGKKLNAPIKEGTVVHSAHGGFAIVCDKWKYIQGRGSNKGNTYPIKGRFQGIDVSGCTAFTKVNSDANNPDPVQLYDLSLSRQEKTEDNVYASNPALVKRLDSLLEHYKSYGRSAPSERSYAFFDDLMPSKSMRQSKHPIRHSEPKIGVNGAAITVSGIDRFILSSFDMKGRILSTTQGERDRTVTLRNHGTGMYIVKIVSESETATYRVFLSR